MSSISNLTLSNTVPARGTDFSRSADRANKLGNQPATGLPATGLPATGLPATGKAADPAKIADAVFNTIDSKQQGYLTLNDLQDALNPNASAGTAKQNDASQLFERLDANSDGKLSKTEFSSGIKKLSEQFDQQYNQSRTSTAGTDSSAAQGTAPPQGKAPPPGARPAGDADGDKNGDSGTGSGSASSLNQGSASKVYDPADSNQDGKVSQQETIAYQNKIQNSLVSSAGASSSAVSNVNNNNNIRSKQSSADKVASSNLNLNQNSTSPNQFSLSSDANFAQPLNQTSKNLSTASASLGAPDSSNKDLAIFRNTQLLLRAYGDPLLQGKLGTPSSQSSVSVSV